MILQQVLKDCQEAGFIVRWNSFTSSGVPVLGIFINDVTADEAGNFLSAKSAKSDENESQE